jgi:hypothetical protein
VPGIDAPLSLLVRSVSCIEGHYGDWFPPGTHNWGAITAGSSWKGETFEHEDSYYDEDTGKNVHYTTAFRSYPSSAAAAKDLRDVLVNEYPAAVAAARAGDWSLVSAKLYGYYRGTVTKSQAIAAHRNRLLQCMSAITTATGETVTVTQRKQIVGQVLFLGTLVVLPVWLWFGKLWHVHRNG